MRFIILIASILTLKFEVAISHMGRWCGTTFPCVMVDKVSLMSWLGAYMAPTICTKITVGMWE